MTPDFVRQFAPNLALPPMDGGGAGMAGPDQPYDSSGTPLPYLQQGGQRQYFGAQAAPAQLSAGLDNPTPQYDATGTPLPFMQQGGQRQYFGTPGADGLRGSTPPAVATPGPDGLRGRDQSPMSVPPTQDLMRNGVRNGIRNGSPSATLRIPQYPQGVVEDRIMQGIQSGRIDPYTSDWMQAHPQPGSSSSANQGPTLADLLSHLNFQMPDMSGIFGTRQSDGLRGRTQTVQRPSYVADANALGEYPDFGTDQGLADFNRRMNLNLGPQVRSQAEQNNLRAGGYTTAPVSWHTQGRAADIRPRDIGGLRGQAAVEEVRRRAIAAGYNVGQMQFIWEDGVHRGTGAHVHIEPVGHPR